MCIIGSLWRCVYFFFHKKERKRERETQRAQEEGQGEEKGEGKGRRRCRGRVPSSLLLAKEKETSIISKSKHAPPLSLSIYTTTKKQKKRRQREEEVALARTHDATNVIAERESMCGEDALKGKKKNPTHTHKPFCLGYLHVFLWVLSSFFFLFVSPREYVVCSFFGC